MRLPVRYRQTEHTDLVETICASWQGTGYGLNRRTKGVYVDCVHFVAGVLDELFGSSHSSSLNSLLPDACVHNRRGVASIMRKWLRLYPHDLVVDGSLEAGDVVLLGPNGEETSTSHVLIAGECAKLWHATSGPGVCYIGYVLPQGLRLRAVFRSSEKYLWKSK